MPTFEELATNHSAIELAGTPWNLGTFPKVLQLASEFVPGVISRISQHH
jgi:hypothetical protein